MCSVSMLNMSRDEVNNLYNSISLRVGVRMNEEVYLRFRPAILVRLETLLLLLER